jgi:hypothetical protein
MPRILLSALLLLPFLAFGQDKYQQFKSRPVDTIAAGNIPPDVAEVLRNRRLSLQFYNVTTSLAEPSSLSLWGTDYTWQTDRAFQKKPFILNAEVRVPIAIGGEKWHNRGKTFHAIQVIPRFKVRIFNDDSTQRDVSLPVRTPSFMPGLKYFFTTRKLWDPQRLVRTYFTFYAYHHSNGQDGDEFETATRINTYNGNFSENIVFELGFAQFKGGYSDPIDLVDKNMIAVQAQKQHLFYWSGNYEYHPKTLSNKVLAAQKVYGRHRLNAQGGYIIAPKYRDLIYSEERDRYYAKPFQPIERRRFIANLSYILDGNYRHIADNKIQGTTYFHPRRLNLDVAYYEKITRTPYAAAFVQAGYWGSDPYNIYFAQSLFFARFGLAFGFFGNDYF